MANKTGTVVRQIVLDTSGNLSKLIIMPNFCFHLTELIVICCFKRIRRVHKINSEISPVHVVLFLMYI